MIRKIGMWIRNYLFNNHDSCYTDREYEGIAVFGLCGGLLIGGTISNVCSRCKYYVGEKE